MALVICTAAAALAAPTVTETAWMSRGDRLIVLTRTADHPAGFDAISIEVRSLRKNGAMKVLSRRHVLKEADLRWLSAKGEHELYRIDVAAALQAASDAYAKEGYKPVIRIEAASGAVDFLGVPLLTAVHNKGTRVAVNHVENGRACTVARARRETIPLSHDRVAKLQLARLSSISLSADRDWIAFEVDTNVPLHAEVGWRRRVFVMPLRTFMRRLGIKPSDLEAEDLS